MSDYQTKLGLNEPTRDSMIGLLNQHLADTSDLYSQTKQAHWNVVGPRFIALHELFDALAAEVLLYVDLIAERVTALGGAAEGTTRMAAAASRLPEFPRKLDSGEQALDLLIERYAGLANSARQAIDISADQGDSVTSDLLTEVVRGLDKNIYFLEQHCRGGH